MMSLDEPLLFKTSMKTIYVNLGIEKFQTTRRDGHCL